MKKLLFLLLICSGCTYKEVKTPNQINVPDFEIEGYQHHSIRILVIDSCEYIAYRIGEYKGLLTHKGNCKFCQKRFDERK